MKSIVDIKHVLKLQIYLNDTEENLKQKIMLTLINNYRIALIKFHIHQQLVFLKKKVRLNADYCQERSVGNHKAENNVDIKQQLKNLLIRFHVLQ
jgi:hypothetical protein